MRISDWSSDVCSSDLPVLPQHNRIGGKGADLFDEASKVERHLWIGRAIIDIGRGDGLCLSELVDLDHPGRDRAARRLPDETACQPSRKRKATEEGEPPVFRLHPC